MQHLESELGAAVETERTRASIATESLKHALRDEVRARVQAQRKTYGGKRLDEAREYEDVLARLRRAAERKLAALDGSGDPRGGGGGGRRRRGKGASPLSNGGGGGGGGGGGMSRSRSVPVLPPGRPGSREAREHTRNNQRRRGGGRGHNPHGVAPADEYAASTASPGVHAHTDDEDSRGGTPPPPRDGEHADRSPGAQQRRRQQARKVVAYERELRRRAAAARDDADRASRLDSAYANLTAAKTELLSNKNKMRGGGRR